MERAKEIPILYAYIYRNIKNGSHVNCIVTIDSLIPLLRKVVHTSPKIVQMDIFKDLEKLGLIKLIENDKCMILNNKECEKKLKEYVFPIHP